MKLLLATTAAIGLAVAPAAYAQQPTVPSPAVQGQGSVKGSGGAATGAPGGLIQGQGSTQGTVGASGSAPGRVGAGVDAGTGANVKAGGAKATGGVKAKGGATVR